MLAGRHVAMLFEKASLRTRSTFEIAIHELGGHVLALRPDAALGGREPVADVARNLERWVDAVIIRTFSQQLLQEFAAAAERLHVINALTDDEHPCQALSDCLTLREHWGSLRGRTIAYVGDGNNVAASLAHAAAMVGAHLHVASPDGYQLPRLGRSPGDERRAPRRAAAPVHRPGGRRRRRRRRLHRYLDVHGPGRRSRAVRRRIFAPYQVNEALMALAKPGALFMHCLPAHRGEEVTAEVFESPASIVFDQAENRLHCQKALLMMLLAPASA